MNSPIAAFAFFCAITIPCLGQGSVVSNGQVYLYKTESERHIIDGLIRQRQEIDGLRQAVDARNYYYRDPKPEEIAAKVKAWNAANPFISSLRMPDFSKQKIRVEKSYELDRRLLEIEARLEELKDQQREDRKNYDAAVTASAYKAPAPNFPQPNAVPPSNNIVYALDATLPLLVLKSGEKLEDVALKNYNRSTGRILLTHKRNAKTVLLSELPNDVALGVEAVAIYWPEKPMTDRSSIAVDPLAGPSIPVAKVEQAVPRAFVPEGGSAQFSIFRATYGAGSIQRDVTTFVEQRIRNNRLEISANNDQFGGDPIFGQVKTLRIDYFARGARQSKEFREGSKVSLP